MSDRNLATFGPDGIIRPAWAQSTPATRQYFDTEWGRPIRHERGLFELLALEVFVVGLSWSLVLQRRPALAQAFCDFDPDAIAIFTEETIADLLDNASIIRNPTKIRAVINNAKATIHLREEGGLEQLMWSFAPHGPMPPHIPSFIPESYELARALKTAGFTMVGPSTMYALMQAAGIANTRVLYSGIKIPTSRKLFSQSN